MGDLDGILGEVAWLNGRFLPREAFAIPVGDAGFVMGVTVTEQLRTFRGQLFLPEPHARRLRGSLDLVGIDPASDMTSIMDSAAHLAAHNHARLLADSTSLPADPPADLGVVIFVTAGDLAAQHGGRCGPPRVGIHSFPLSFGLWADAYERGVALRSVSVAQVPAACWPLAAKVRSRLHYFLADREAALAEPAARAVLAHADGRISETSTANVAVVHQGRVTVPPPDDALGGVSLAFASELAGQLGIPWEARSLMESDLAQADEILLTSTPSCLLPATRFNGRPVGLGRPGPVFTRLLASWNAVAEIDIAAQARHHAGSHNPVRWSP
jgi:branched-chain amino acid aminotransferase